MKGYLVKYSSGSYDDYRTHDIRVYLDRNLSERYVNKFNRVYSNLKKFYIEKWNSSYDIEEEQYEVRATYWEDMCDKARFWRDIGEAWVEEIEIVESIKKKGNARWD